MRQAVTRMAENGRVLLPAAVREAAGFRPGEDLIAVAENGGVRLLSRRQAVRQAQAAVRRYIPAGRSLVDELLAERRREVTRE